MGSIQKLAFATVLILAIGPFSACGSGVDGSSRTEGASGDDRTSVGARSFASHGVTLYGHEGKPSERRQASRVVEAWMRARATANWAKDCGYFSKQFRRTIVADAHRVSDGKVENCPQ